VDEAGGFAALELEDRPLRYGIDVDMAVKLRMGRTARASSRKGKREEPPRQSRRNNSR